MGSVAFGSCSSLTSITCLAVTPPVCDNECFKNIPSECVLYVPMQSVEDYKATYPWSEFFNIVGIDTSVPTESIAIEGVPEGYLTVGKTVSLSAVIAPENATQTEVLWTSSDDSVAAVSEEGLVTAVAPGIVYISVAIADNPEIMATCIITVVKSASSAISSLTADENGLYNVYTLNGNKVMTVDDINSLSGLPKGLYIINGKKLMIGK